MRKLEWDDMGVKVDSRQVHHLRFADDIVLITPSISQVERMLNEFDETCGCICLQLNLDKTMFMRNGWVTNAPFTLNGTDISECTSYVYLGRELNMMDNLTPELGWRRRAAWGAYKSIENVMKKTRNTRLRAHLFNTTVLPALTYASETWAFRKQEENAVSVIERVIERVMLGVSRFTQVRDGIRSSLLCQRSKIRDAAAFAKEDRRPDGQISSRSPSKKGMMLFVSHAKEEPLGYSGTRPGQMKELLAPARPVQRSTGVKVIKVESILWIMPSIANRVPPRRTATAWLYLLYCGAHALCQDTILSQHVFCTCALHPSTRDTQHNTTACTPGEFKGDINTDTASQLYYEIISKRK
ncbi:hypothetical protein RB195_025071 [Necator americanus]